MTKRRSASSTLDLLYALFIIYVKLLFMYICRLSTLELHQLLRAVEAYGPNHFLPQIWRSNIYVSLFSPIVVSIFMRTTCLHKSPTRLSNVEPLNKWSLISIYVQPRRTSSLYTVPFCITLIAPHTRRAERAVTSYSAVSIHIMYRILAQSDWPRLSSAIRIPISALIKALKMANRQTSIKRPK